MSPAAGAKTSAPSKAGKLGGSQFEETFRPKSRESTARELADDKGKRSGKDGKKRSRFPIVLIIILIILVLLGGSVAVLYFSGNLTKLIDGALNAVGLQMISSASAPPAAETPEPADSLDYFGGSIDIIEEAKPGVSEPVEATPTPPKTFEEIRAGFSEEKLAELKQVGTIYSKMDPEAAAKIMTKIYDVRQIAIIIYYMRPASSALVLAKLDPALAAEVTTLLTS